jgi:aminoglycoside 3-N-acetyltransferase
MSAYPLTRPLELTDEERSQGIAWKIRLLPEDSDEPTGMGAVSDSFKSREDVVCGTGIHRTCAWGSGKDRHAQGYRHLLETRGLALLIGVGIDRCSSLHLADRTEITPEARSAMDAAWAPLRTPELSPQFSSGYPHDILVGQVGGWCHGDPWTDCFEEAERRGLVKHGRVGAADSLLFVVADLVEILEGIRREGPTDSQKA